MGHARTSPYVVRTPMETSDTLESFTLEAGSQFRGD